ncbi:hypothetical protein [Clavibacter sp. CFBP 8614]|uniref:hypothetical protein n=1 Tax=unclassified Clavibacter TaxID=2626594 RepID=UPI004040F58E
MSEPTPDPSATEPATPEPVTPEPATPPPASETGAAAGGPALPPPAAAPAGIPPIGVPPTVGPATGVSPTGVSPTGAAPHRPNPVVDALRGLTVRDRIVAVVAGAGAYVAAYLVGVVCLLLTIAVAIASNSGSGSGSGASSGSSGGMSTPSIPDALGAIGNIFAGPAQLISLADLGRLGVSGALQVIVPVTGSLSVGVLPVTVGLAQLLALVLVARYAGRRDQPFRVRLAGSVISGLVLAVISLVFGLLLAFRIPASSGVSIGDISATTVGSVFVAFLVGVSATLLARPGWLTSLHPVIAAGLGTLRVAASHLGALVVVSAVVIVIGSAFAGSSGPGAALPLFLGNLAVVLAAVSMFATASPSDFLVQVAQSAAGSRYQAGNTDLSVLSGPASIWLLVLLSVLLAFVAGIALAIRRGAVARRGVDWAATPAAYFVLGILGLVLGTAVVSVHVATVNGDGSIGLTPWLPVILALWGGAIETVARFVAPRVLAVTPAPLTGLVARLVGRDAAAVAAWTPRARPVNAPGVGAATAASAAGAVQGGDAPAGEPTDTASAPAVAGLPAPRALSPRGRRILIRSSIAGGAVVLLIVALSITGGVLRSTVWGPGSTAQRFVQAIADGDASTAGTLAQIDGIGSGMLTDQVLQSAKTRISDVQLGLVHQDGDTATATVTYKQGTDPRTTQVGLTRVSTSWLIQDEWRVTSSLGGKVVVQAPAALEGAKITADGIPIGQVAHASGYGGGVQSFAAFPGDYTIAVEGTDYFAAPTADVTVADAGTVPVSLSLAGTDKLTADASKLVQDTITSCAARTDAKLPSECPFSGPYYYSNVSNVSYTVTRMPELKVIVRDDGSIGVISTTSGQVEEKYQTSYSFEPTPEQHDYQDTFQVAQRLKVVNGQLTVTDSY